MISAMNTDNLSCAFYFATIVIRLLPPLKVFFVNLEIALRMCTYGAEFRSLGSYNNVSAVAAFPNGYA